MSELTLLPQRSKVMQGFSLVIDRSSAKIRNIQSSDGIYGQPFNHLITLV